MAAPRHTPKPATDSPRGYSSPDHVPDRWIPDRPGELDGPQPTGAGLGTPGPDQGFALRIARRLSDEVQLQPGEHLDDAVRGSVLIALRRASMFSRAPVVHDLRIAFTIWGFFDPDPPADLVAVRRQLFEGVSNTAHHYVEGRILVDMVPAEVLASTPAEVLARYPGDWPILTGVGDAGTLIS